MSSQSSIATNPNANIVTLHRTLNVPSLYLKQEYTEQIDLATGKNQHGRVVGGIPNQNLETMSIERLQARKEQLLNEMHGYFLGCKSYERAVRRPAFNLMKNEVVRIGKILGSGEEK